MNYLSHIYVANSENPLINLGTILPDIFSSIKIKGAHIRESYSLLKNELTKSIEKHILADKIFHSKDYCGKEQKKIPEFNRLEHLLLELCIDYLILESNSKQMYKKVNSIDTLISSENKEIKELENYFEFSQETSHSFYARTKNVLKDILSYENEEGIINGINRILKRINMNPIPKEKNYLDKISIAIEGIKDSYLKMLEEIKQKVSNQLS